MREFTHAGLTFDVRDAGPPDAPCVVLLHGFPQDSTAWSGITPALNAAGLRTLAPDLRGYSPRARPRERGAYTLDRLAADVLALLDAAGVTRAHVVGHDWGAGLAWHLAIHHADRVSTLTAVSVPHLAAMSWAVRHSDQALRSWYMAAMQVPWLPELALARGARGGLAGLDLPEEHARAYAARLARPRDATGPVNWYRGILARRRLPRPRPVTCPTTFVWGNRDRYLGRAGAERTAHYCHGEYRFVELDADHWLPEKRADAVSALVLERVGSTG